MNTVEGRLGDTAEKTGSECTRCSLAHLSVVVAHGKNQHTGSCTEAGEVPGAHWALDEVVAESLDIDQHQRIQWPVQAQRYEERVEHRNEDCEYEWCVRVHPCQARADAVTKPDAQRANKESGQRNHNQHGDKRHEDHLHILREDLLQTVVDHCQDGHHD